MKILKRILAVAILILVILVISYAVYTAKGIHDSEAVYACLQTT